MKQQIKKVIDWIRQVEDLGAGEIIVTFVDKEGTGKGIDQEFSKKCKPMKNKYVLI